jgi:hypothetical protein
MSRFWWVVVLVAAGVGAAVVIGLVGTRNEPSSSASTPEALSVLCSSLRGLGSSVANLTDLSSSSSKADWKADLTAVDDAWDQVESDFHAVQNASSGGLDSAWDSFTSAVKNVPSADSVADAVSSVTQSADQLVAAAQSTAAQLSCSSPTGTTTTSG